MSLDDALAAIGSALLGRHGATVSYTPRSTGTPLATVAQFNESAEELLAADAGELLRRECLATFPTATVPDPGPGDRIEVPAGHPQAGSWDVVRLTARDAGSVVIRCRISERQRSNDPRVRRAPAG
jgi:hypothetical protein